VTAFISETLNHLLNLSIQTMINLRTKQVTALISESLNHSLNRFVSKALIYTQTNHYSSVDQRHGAVALYTCSFVSAKRYNITGNNVT